MKILVTNSDETKGLVKSKTLKYSIDIFNPDNEAK